MAFWESDGEKKRKEMEEVKKQVEGRETKLPEPPAPAETRKTEEAPPRETPETGGGEEGIEEPSLEAPTTAPKPPQPEKEGEGESTGRERRKEVEESSLPTTRRPEETAEEEESAPLFVKIDKYRQVIQNLEQIKNSLKDLRDLFALMDEIDGIKREGMKELRDGISSLADGLISMDEKFIRPRGAREFRKEGPSERSRTVQELQDELKDVRRELNRLG